MNNALLEVANGVWAILALWLTAFMIYHIVLVLMQRHIGWRRVLLNFDLPISVQLAFGVLVISIAVLVTRGIIWLTRIRTGGNVDAIVAQSGLYLFGTALGVAGFLSILRTISQPTFGHWPWVGALISSGAYLVWWSILHLH